MKLKTLCFLFLTFLATVTVNADEEEELLEIAFEEESLIAAVDNLGPTAGGFLSVGEFGPQDDDTIDPHVLRDFIESRGLIECRNKEGKLIIAGDVRARWNCTAEQVNHQRIRGINTNTAINIFKSEVNLFFDYIAPRSWVSTKLRWSTFDGIDGGSSTRVDLDRAFLGYDIFNKCDEDFYIEVGRSKLDYLFDSRVEFGSTFDGIHIYYTNEFKKFGTFVIHGGPFIVDSYTNHYAWIIEATLLRWMGTGLGFKYSLVDWEKIGKTLDYGNLSKSGQNFVRDNPRYRFIVSQMLFGYEKKISFLGCKTLYIYSAFLVNHDPRRSRTTNYKKLNGAFYAGFTLGKLCKACDWSLDIMYQSVQAQAVPEFDLSGIGHGNGLNSLLSDAILHRAAPFDARGFTNYKGWQFNFLFALTDTLSLRAKLEWSRPRNKSVGGTFRYQNFEMAAIYAF